MQNLLKFKKEVLDLLNNKNNFIDKVTEQLADMIRYGAVSLKKSLLDEKRGSTSRGS